MSRGIPTLVVAIVVVAIVASAIACSSTTRNPAVVSFGGRTYEVVYDGAVYVVDGRDRVRALGSGVLYAHDFTGDGVDDLAVLEDERDGFRRTFAYLDIFKNDGTPIWLAAAHTAKLKDGRWIWVDRAEFPGLADFSPTD